MKLGYVLAAATILIGTTTAQAQSAGDFILSAGWNHFRTQSGSQAIGATTYADETYESDRRFMLSDVDNLGLTGTYFFTDHLAGELALSTPVHLNATGLDDKNDAINLSSVRLKNASLLLKYYFFDAQAKFRPYLGVGIGRVWFDKQISHVDYFTLPVTYHTSFKNKWVPILNGGLSYQFSKHWVGGLSITYMPLKTTASTHSIFNDPSDPDFDPYPVSNKTKFKLNPVVTTLSLGYRF